MQIREIIKTEDFEKINKLFKKMTSESEFEIMFFNYNKNQENRLSLENYHKILLYLSKRGELIQTKTLDINLKEYRITVKNIDAINETMTMFKKYNNLTSIQKLLKMPNIEIIKKTKSKSDIIDIDELFLRIRLAQEEHITNITNITNYTDEIKFRYKDRATLFIKNDKKCQIRIDLTSVRQVNEINMINYQNPQYELEIEIMTSNTDLDYLTTALNETETLLKVIQESKYIICNSDKQNVLNTYQRILHLNDKHITLAGRQPVSLEFRHLINMLPNKYAVTDKADGDRYFLIITCQKVYLISTNLNVKYTGIDLKNDMYNDTILDGEYIFLPEYNKHLFMVFDCLISQGKDVRTEIMFMKRINYADKIIEACFGIKNQNTYQIQEYQGNTDMESIIKYHKMTIIENMKKLNNDISKAENILIRRKYFIPVIGLQDNEIYKYSVLMWNLYMYSQDVKCPYILDGLIYQPLNEKYITDKRQINLFEYKWKPPNNNTIDFYIEFLRDENNKIIYVFDNSGKFVKNKPYIICNLHVGEKSKTGETPVKFNEKIDQYQTYLFIDKYKNVLDIEGNIIQDKTVVEFYYNQSLDIHEMTRWTPIRTRYDKTESVMMHKKKYGNEMRTALRIWDSIIYPVLLTNLEILANDATYKKHKFQIEQDENKQIKRTESIYYQVQTDLAKPMRSFHNWIKDNLIKKYAENAIVLDYACGQGGDIHKYYYGKAKLYIGIDIDYNGIYSKADGAIARYKELQRKFKNVPEMHFIQADGSALLNYESQKKIIKNMSDKNKILLDKFFNTKIKYDLISCQFAIHYFFENEQKLNNFCQNINNNLNLNGILIITCFDAQQVKNLLASNDNYQLTYNTSDGVKTTFFEIKKKFEDNDIKTGQAIDVHNAWISKPNVYQTEYLVDKDYLISQLKNNANLKLVETCLFSEIYKKQESVILQNTQDKHVELVKKYYETTDLNTKSNIITNLNRYYIFKKNK